MVPAACISHVCKRIDVRMPIMATVDLEHSYKVMYGACLSLITDTS